MSLIHAAGLNLTFQAADGPLEALRDIDLDIEKGSFVSLIGPSGCGKTSLLRVIAGLETPSAGHIEVDGGTPDEARINRAYGYVFQSAGLLPWRSVAGNVRLPLELMGFDKAAQARRIAETLALVNLSGFEKKYPWQLSGGMQQRVSIARALSFDADILLMDEPFGALDEISRDQLNEHLLTLWRQTRKTVVFVTHSISEAVFLSTKIVVMSSRPGRIVDVIESPLNPERPLSIRDSQAFLETAERVRAGLREGYGHD